MDRKIEQLKTIPTENYTEDDKEILRNEWIINWVGWSNLPVWVRIIMTQLFYYLDFEIHDINYWKLTFVLDKKEREKLRKKADFWILKYSWIWPIKAIEEFSLTGKIIKDLIAFEYMLIKFTLNLVPMLLSPLAYMAVRLGWEKAINQTINNEQ